MTGFGPFANITENPSWVLARQCGLEAEELEVSFGAVDKFFRELSPAKFDALLMIGVAGRSRVQRLERFGRNQIGGFPDVTGVVQTGPIDQDAPSKLRSTLWETGHLVRPGTRFSTDAGTYLCNYALFRALQRFPNNRVGFLHVPTFESMQESRQLELLHELLMRIQN